MSDINITEFFKDAADHHSRRVPELLIPQRADLEDYRSRFDALKRRLGIGG